MKHFKRYAILYSKSFIIAIAGAVILTNATCVLAEESSSQTVDGSISVISTPTNNQQTIFEAEVSTNYTINSTTDGKGTISLYDSSRNLLKAATLDKGISYPLDAGKTYIIDVCDTEGKNIPVTITPEAFFVPTAYQVVLDGNFNVNFFVEEPTEIAQDTSSHMLFRIGTESEQSTASITPDKKALYTCDVASSQLADNIVTQLYYNGHYYPASEFSIKGYLETLLQDDHYEKFHELAKALLLYGGYSQTYFGYNIGNLASAGLDKDPIPYLTDSEVSSAISSVSVGTNSNSDFSFYGASLICEMDTSLRVYFTNIDNLSLDEIQNKYDIHVTGGSYTEYDTGIKGNLFYITVKNIPATDLSTDYQFSIINGSDNINFCYSPFFYIKQTMNSQNTNLKNLCKALYLYNLQAKVQS